MAFDRPIEADRVDDLGLFASLIRAPVVGIMWLLGGEHANDNEAEKEAKRKQENERMERELLGESSGENGGDGRADSSNGCRDTIVTDVDEDDPHDVSSSAMSTSSQPVHQAEVKGHDKENEDPSSLQQQWPSPGFLDSSHEDASNCKRPCSSGQPPRRENKSNGMDCPGTQIIDDLVTAMESSHITIQPNSGSPGPASAVLSSQSKITFSSTNSLSASYSASTFSNHHNASQTLSQNSSVNNGTHPSQSFTQNNSNSSIRGNKKMSWSDECGNHSLVEYYDDPAVTARSKHWSAMRRKSLRASRHSFDGGDKGSETRRSEVRVIKSALKRSGSYSPPVTLYASNGRGVTASASSSTDSSCTSSYPEMRSFRSLSVIGSSDSSKSSSSDHSQCTDDSVAAVTNKKLNSNDVQCVPSTLQGGSGRVSGGMIIPSLDQPAKYYFPRGGPDDPRYQLLYPKSCGQQTEASSEQGEQDEKSSRDVADVKVLGSTNPATAITGGRSSPGHHHHFLPRHTNGYISPQYGFYVNITPPTPELYAARNPGDKPPRSAVQQQSYQQFQYQNKYQAPSPIPEGGPGGPQGIPQRFVGRSSVPRPSSKKSSEERDQMSAARQNSLKPTFTKNKKGMGMLLAENPHHGVWPTVPFG